MEHEDNILPRKIEGIAKGLDIPGSWVIEYYVRSKSGCIISLRDKGYYFTGLPKDLHTIFSQDICTSEGFMGTLVYNSCDKNDRCVELELKEEIQVKRRINLWIGCTSSINQTTTSNS